MARRMSAPRAPKVAMLATRNSKTWPTIVRRFRKSRKVTSPPPSLAANSATTRPSSSLVPAPETALSQTSSWSDRRRSIGISDSREPSTWRIVFGKNCTTPVSSVAVTTSRALALSWKGSSVASVRLTRVTSAEAMVFGWWRVSSRAMKFSPALETTNFL